MVFEHTSQMGHELVVHCYDKATGTRGIIAVHDTSLGPALGGLRRWNYASEEEALIDALRLSEGMTYKCAAAGLPVGGGKSVLWKTERDTPVSEAEARAFAKRLDMLGGRYVAAEDVGITPQYIDWMAQETKHVMGGETVSTGGDPSPYTAEGVVLGMRAALAHTGKDTNLQGIHIALQGLGHVGMQIARIARKEGATLTVADINEQAVEQAVAELGATAVSVDKIIAVECDIFCPCALGAGLNPESIPTLCTSIVCGAANNQLLDQETDGDAIAERGILYCPDFIVNAGGVIHLAGLWSGFNKNELTRIINHIEHTTAALLAQANGKNTQRSAIHYAKQCIAENNPFRPGAVDIASRTQTIGNASCH